jgi:uridine monophosphate synthetase
MMTFFSRLESRIHSVDSLLCIGLDPHQDDFPVFTGQAVKSFCLRLIQETADIAAAYKPNSAFFEVLGAEGISVLSEVIAAVPDEIPVILDAKRGDISSTANAYSQAIFTTLGADAVTINPYLGYDALKPFLSDPDKGVFLLCKTSNPGASVLQDLQVIPPSMAAESGNCARRDIPTIPLYIQVARLAQEWNTRDNIGLVVGATQPESLERIRSVAPDLWILAPGVGAQGGDLSAALSTGLRADGYGLLLPVSRGISRSDNPAEAANQIRDAINRERRELLNFYFSTPVESRQPVSEALTPKLAHIADGLLDVGCIKFGRFTLKSGIESPIYIDLRRLAGFPQLLIDVAGAYIDILRDLQFDHLGALPYAALPISTAISLEGNWSMIYPRKEVKSYGTSAQIEGVYESGEKVVVIDDLISTGGSKFEGIEKFESEGLTVQDVVVLIDRSVDGAEEMKRRGYSFHAALTLSQILTHYEQRGAVGKHEIDAARDFLLRKG